MLNFLLDNAYFMWHYKRVTMVVAVPRKHTREIASYNGGVGEIRLARITPSVLLQFSSSFALVLVQGDFFYR